jgi:3-hydroxyacyl-[acyl-carrier-protein] dehydratase
MEEEAQSNQNLVSEEEHMQSNALKADDQQFSIDGLSTRRLSPYGPPFLMLDRVDSYRPVKKTLSGSKCLGQNEPMLQGHFPGYPIFPGVLLIECLVQTSSFLMNLDQLAVAGEFGDTAMETLAATKPRNLLVESKIKHISPVFPGDRIVLESEITGRADGRCSFRVRALVNGIEVTKGQITLENMAQRMR